MRHLDRWSLGRIIHTVLAAGMVVGLLLTARGQALAQSGGWSTPVMISTNTVSSWFPDVAVDDWGQPHVVWNTGRLLDTQEGRIDLLMYSTLAEQGWLEPNDIVVPSYGAYTIRPAVAVDRAGDLHVTFRSYTMVYYVRASRRDAWNASSWTPRRSISGAGGGSAYYSDVAVDEQGVIHVVWNESVATDVEERWLWFGTPAGGALYDGTAWRSQEPQRGLGALAVHAIIEDGDGVQWFGTAEGAYRFDGATWQRFAVEDGLIGQRVNCLLQDMDGKLWFGMDGGVAVYDPLEQEASDQWVGYTVADGLPGNVVHAMAMAPLGAVWLGTDQGLASYDGERWVGYTPQDGLVAAEVLAVAVDARGHVWAGTSQGVSQYDGKRWITYTAENGLLSNAITSVVVDREGRVWVGTDKGLSWFDGQVWSSVTADQGLSSGAVTALMVDSEGTLWAGTETGVSRYDGRTWQPFGLPQGFAGQRVTAIAEDRQVNAICPSCADVFYRHSNDGGTSWSVPVNLSDSFGGSVKPQVRLGGGGHVYVTWEEGEDWYTNGGYPVGCGFAHSSDGGNTWAESSLLTSVLGAPQQITLGVGQGGSLVAIWRLPESQRVGRQQPPERDRFYYQLSADHGATWSDPRPIPGVMVRRWASFSLDAYDAATDSAGNIHLMVLGHRYSVDEDLGLFHLVWNGSEWSAPALLYASSDPPEWPRIAIGAGNQVYATWFVRDERHIEDPDHGRYRIWVSHYQSSAPPQTPVPSPPPSPTLASDTPGLEALTPTPTQPPAFPVNTSGPPSGLTTENDEVARLAVALAPVIVILLVVTVLRFRKR